MKRWRNFSDRIKENWKNFTFFFYFYKYCSKTIFFLYHIPIFPLLLFEKTTVSVDFASFFAEQFFLIPYYLFFSSVFFFSLSTVIFGFFLMYSCHFLLVIVFFFCIVIVVDGGDALGSVGVHLLHVSIIIVINIKLYLKIGKKKIPFFFLLFWSERRRRKNVKNKSRRMDSKDLSWVFCRWTVIWDE